MFLFLCLFNAFIMLNSDVCFFIFELGRVIILINAIESFKIEIFCKTIGELVKNSLDKF